MKKLFSLTVILALFITTSFANEGPVPGDKKLTEAFSKYFAAAQSVTWNQTAKIATANFELNGQYLAAHFSPDAKMLGVSRNLSSSDLPFNLRMNLQSYFEKYWVTEAFEYATPASDSYYVTLENADSKLILKSESGRFYVYKKIVKIS
ncbi:MAG TPA: hypothetical protein VK616_01185 [Flavitalea sp.]|nr:hypothetical protein [Flavitalea sp.]HTF29026.1 hypothetical protein [Flavitalea sp.]